MLKLPTVSGQEVVKALSKIDFKFRRQVGSHMILKRQLDGKRLAIPNHREIPKGTLRAIIRQAGLTVDEFVALL
ncbi:MAG: type II toxin-antitoxin system HicA family toxin [Thermoplasmataceae archaeon]